jgi:hypothetical protein
MFAKQEMGKSNTENMRPITYVGDQVYGHPSSWFAVWGIR